MISIADIRIVNLMICKIDKLLSISLKYSREEIEQNYIISDAVQYEFEKLYEDSTRLSVEYRINHPDLPFDQLRSIRNRIAHDYESVSLSILLDTIDNDLPRLKNLLINNLQ